MPELPEVETVCRGLAPLVEGRRIVQVECYRPDLRYPFPHNLTERLQDKVIQQLTRRAKYMLWQLDNGEIMVSHLGMTGKWLYSAALPNRHVTHDHLRLRLDDGACVTYNDARRFGFLGLLSPGDYERHAWFAALGPEPLEEAFTGTTLFTRSRGRIAPVKAFIMDQSIVVGVGNIYACEALYRARLHPQQESSKITKKQWDCLVEAIKAVLTEAIASGGSTLRDFVRSSGDSGYFQHHHAVYGREGEECPECRAPIQRIVQSGRSSFFCPRCQSHHRKSSHITPIPITG